MAYSDKVLDHYENPRNVGSFAKDESGVGTGMVGAPACGDVMKLQIKVGPDGRIEDAKFKTYTQIAEELALPPVKIHCSILAEDAIKAAVADYRQKHGSEAERQGTAPVQPVTATAN
jgi:nitrogen fixation NifU-like protein